jgi:hypothetical protein
LPCREIEFAEAAADFRGATSGRHTPATSTTFGVSNTKFRNIGDNFEQPLYTSS